MPERLECLNESTDCMGRIELRESLSGTGTPIPRCAFHWEQRLDLEDQISERYPMHAPSDWSPLDAGESWDPID
jgi:hypothetical protein